MGTFKKKDLNELVGGDINNSGNDRNPSNDSEIETGPTAKSYDDTSDYEKGQSTTTDKVFGHYRQNIPWFAIYSFGGTRSGGGIKTFENTEKTTILKKKSVEEKINDLVKKTKASDVTQKGYNPKVEKLIDTIEDSELTDKQLDDLSNAILNKKNTPNKNNKI